jgi:hypothetical protein
MPNNSRVDGLIRSPFGIFFQWKLDQHRRGRHYLTTGVGQSAEHLRICNLSRLTRQCNKVQLLAGAKRSQSQPRINYKLAGSFVNISTGVKRQVVSSGKAKRRTVTSTGTIFCPSSLG